MSTTSPIVGIDLGTTHSACAFYDGGTLRWIPNALGQKLTPSVVALERRSGVITVGRTARDIQPVSPHLAASGFKRDMGTTRTYRVGERDMSAEELSAYVLDSIKADCERELGYAVNRCVVSVPAYFGEPQRVATQRAAEMAGWVVERIINEPTAAAMAYGLHNAEADAQFMVFDLGGGTFDVCVMELFEGLLEVKSVAGESRLGGEDFTLALAEAVLTSAEVDSEAAKADADAWPLILKRAETLKRTLSRWPSAQIELPVIRRATTESVYVTVSQEMAKAAWAPLLDRMVRPCREALRGAEMSPGDLDHVVLVGGATRMPVVRAFVSEILGHEPMVHGDPDLVVAEGAAVQAALYANDEAVGDIVVTDVASHSLGVAVVRDIAGRMVSGYFSPVIHRNTVIPTARTERFNTIDADQRSITLAIYEGDSRKVAGNTKLGELEVNGLPAGPAGKSAVDVTFAYDISGLLQVSARVVGVESKVVTKAFSRNSGLSEDDRRSAEARLAALRQHPLDRPRYRDALARAELLWKESPEQQRDALTYAIDVFEAAIETRRPDEMEKAYAQLLALCERLDGNERW